MNLGNLGGWSIPWAEAIEMELWTLQHPDVWKALQEDGLWHVKDSLIFCPKDEDSNLNHGHYAYRWLAEQMKQRIGPPPAGVHFPIWADFKRYGQTNGKPDMRAERWFYKGPIDRLRLEIDESRVLLSDYDDWHAPLNYWYLSKSEEDSKAFDDWHESLGVDYRDIHDWGKDSPELREVRRRVEESWFFMFDLESPRDEGWHFPYIKRSIQATFWELRREDVVSWERFQGVGKW